MDLMTYALCKGNGGGSGGDNRFIVTLTPTAQDYSGFMDTTVAEIYDAYDSGKQIWFKVLTGATAYVEVPVSFIGRDTSFDYPNFGAEIVKSDANLMIVAETTDTNDATNTTYLTKVYSLTPVS